MEIKAFDYKFTICKGVKPEEIRWSDEFCFAGKTDEEMSLVCLTESVPAGAGERDDGWMAFRIQGVLDFSLTGILSKISGILADCGIAIFALSTFQTDYILTKQENFEQALSALREAGYVVVRSMSPPVDQSRMGR